MGIEITTDALKSEFFIQRVFTYIFLVLHRIEEAGARLSRVVPPLWELVVLVVLNGQNLLASASS